VHSEREYLHPPLHSSARNKDRNQKYPPSHIPSQREREQPRAMPYTPSHVDREEPYPTPYTQSPRALNPGHPSPYTPSPRSLSSKMSAKGSNRYRHRKQLEERKASAVSTPASEGGQSELSFFSSTSSAFTGSAISRGSRSSHSTLANRASKALQARRHRQSHLDQAAAQNLTRRMLSARTPERTRPKKKSSPKKGERGLASRYNTSDRFIQGPNRSFGSDSTSASSHLYSLASDESEFRKSSTRSADHKMDHFVEKSATNLGALASAYNSANLQQIANDMKEEVTSSVSDSFTALATEIGKLVPKSPNKSKDNDGKSKLNSLRKRAISPGDEDVAIEVEYIGEDDEDEQCSGENAASPSRMRPPPPAKGEKGVSKASGTAGESSFESQRVCM